MFLIMSKEISDKLQFSGERPAAAGERLQAYNLFE